MATQSAPRPTPERIFNTLSAYQQTFALKAAIELDVFTKIGEGHDQAAAIAKSIDAPERGVRILCDYMTIQGFLRKENGKYSLTPESATFLDKRSPAYIGSIGQFLAHDDNQRNFKTLVEAVRRGGGVFASGDNTKPNDEFWVQFAESMAPITVPAATFIAKLIEAQAGKPINVLDIAAGHGMYGITISKQNPNARVTAVDWPAVLEVAKKNAQIAGVGDRYSVRPGSAFDCDLGQDYDYVLLTNILHHFDQFACEKLLRRVHASLKPGGKAITLEFVPNADRISPPTAAAFSLVMLANTEGGEAYTFAEYETMLRNVGFGKSSLHAVQDMPQQVVVSEK